jgi:hypothetical protein
MTRTLAALVVASLLGSATCFAFAQKQNAQQPDSTAHTTSTPQEGQPLTGKVVQSMNSGGYTYVLLQTKDKGEVWLAMPQTQVPQGKEMTFGPGMEMSKFESKTLKRTFDRIIFSQGPVGTAAAKGEEKSPGSKGAVAKAAGKIKVAKAAGPNAQTIADVYRLSNKLDKKKVAVRGQVVKVSAGIMERNWIHLQDGTGNAKQGTNNLVVTSQALPLVGDVVTATGTLYKDKDFGGGYRYAVIMEKAELAGK